MKLRKLFSLAMVLALCLALLPALPVSAANGVVTYSDVIGGNSAVLMGVTMGAGRTGRMVLANDSVVDDDVATNLVDRGAEGGYTVAAAANGGFFGAYYKTNLPRSFPDNCPQIYNTIIVNNKLVNAGGKKPVLGFTPEGKPMIDKVDFKPRVRLSSGFAPQAQGANYPCDDPWCIMLYTDEMTLPVEIPADAMMFYIQNGRITNVTGGGTLTVPKNTDVLVYGSAMVAEERGHNRLPKMGETATIYYDATPSRASDKAAWERMETVIGGGPILLLDGQVVTNQNPEFTEGKQQPDYVAGRCFVATTWGGDLLFGAVTSSFNNIAAYLQAKGLKDAMALDGGASTMLYVGGEGYKVQASRKLASVLTIVDEPGAVPVVTTPEPTPTPPATADGIATPSLQTVTVDGKPVEFNMYAVTDTAGGVTNYIRIRDLAAILNGTRVQFNVGWNGSVNLLSGTAYDGSSEKAPFNVDMPYTNYTKSTYVDNLPVALAAIQIEYNGGGYTYYKLRDLGDALGFLVDWAPETGISVSTQ